ncbi:MAG TPA: hypothetical protein PLC53_00930 [Bacilli bacterium]|nr:hypothetical protein [Bacilli bacterium]
MDEPVDYTKKKNIRIICEGAEEKLYIDKLKEIGAFHAIYTVAPLDAKGNTNISSYFQDEYQRGKWDLVLVFCDTEKHSKKNKAKVITDLKDYITGLLGTNISDKLIIFANPVTLLIVLSHFSKVSSLKVSKTSNAQIVEDLTGVKNYKAKEEQIKKIMKKINKTNYEIMKENIKDNSTDEYTRLATNFLYFSEKLSNPDVSWIEEIKDILKNV